MDMDGLEVRAEQHDDMMKMTMEGDDIDMKVEFGDAYDGTMISTMTKFDDYFMYSMDNIDSTHSMAE
jgi:ferritin-like metal-binding protein YciE